MLGLIQCRVIERFWQVFRENRDPEYRYANIGRYTVDLKQMIMFLTLDPENQDQFRKVLRSTSKNRVQFLKQKRFYGQISESTVIFENYNFYIEDWLGKEWRESLGKGVDDFPILFEVQEGIIKETKHLISL